LNSIREARKGREHADEVSDESSPVQAMPRIC
jgi:hypothetical protein